MTVSPSGPRDGYFTSRRLRLHFVEYGDPAAPPLLLIHGGRDHARSWDAVAEALADRWRVIAPDLCGHGDSEWATGGYAMEGFVHDLAQLADQFGSGPMPMIGHSLGGNIALRHAALFPGKVSRLVAIEGLAMNQGTPADPAKRLRDWIARGQVVAAREQRRYPDIATAAAQMKRMNPRLSDALALRIAVQGSIQDAEGRIRFKFDPMMAALTPIDLTAEEKQQLWAEINCPLLMIYGRESWATNPAEDGRAAMFRDVRVEMFDDAGHWVHHDRPDAFLAAVEAFLA